ncbi:zinc finger protein [Macleaya cordata]|uniref:Zinc finger protein n=1 Tax=Macleaya cordata TaxID=56857 RepID=A0A200QE50_MACCD|nr:zinc finger protein [Macleaya cordata]
MLERGCEVLQRRQEMATQRRGARFQQPYQFTESKRQRVHGESSQGPRTQSPARPEGKPNQNLNRQQQQPQQPQQHQRDRSRLQCWNCGEIGHVRWNCPRGDQRQSSRVTQGPMFAISQDDARIPNDAMEGKILVI